MIPVRVRSLPLAAAALVLAACAPAPDAPTASSADAHAAHARADNGELTADQKQQIARVRHATTRFHDIAAAKAAGYDYQYPAGCAVAPDARDGAQGYHWIDTTLVDDRIELLRPELVMYEPKPDGSMQLVGVDYVVPLSASPTPPTLLGVPFMRNDALGVWALHIWAWRPNPSGMFAAWNPKVSCAHAR